MYMIMDVIPLQYIDMYRKKKEKKICIDVDLQLYICGLHNNCDALVKVVC